LKIQLSEAHTDAKFERVLGEMRTGFANVEARLAAVEGSLGTLRTVFLPTVIGTGVGVVAIVVAVLAYGQNWFGSGLALREVVYRQISAQTEQVNKRFDQIDELLAEMSRRLPPPAPLPTKPGG
jgi:hypothetical protein